MINVAFLHDFRFCRESAYDQQEIERLLAPYPDMLTVDKVATILRIHPRSIQRWARDGRVASVRIGRSCRIPRSDIVRWMCESSGGSSKDSPEMRPSTISE
jgi:excisionase family DNA binding protein